MLREQNISNFNDRIYLKIKNMMILYQIVPGQKLQCQDLANLLRVSRTPVRHALNTLAKEGFLKLLPNKGYYAKEITIEEILELYQIREVLEILSMKNAIKRVNPGHLKQLEEKKIAYENVLKEPFGRSRFILDMNFHLTISKIGGNQNLTALLQQILERIYFTYNIDTLSDKRSLEVVTEHERIFSSIKKRSVRLGLQSVRHHFKIGIKYLINGLERRKKSLVT